MDCLFCKIIKGEIPSKTIYEDELVKVFLDINPKTDGHCLMIPKSHIEEIDEITPELITHMLMVTKKISKLLKEKLGMDKLAIMRIGQDVNHLHFHLIPQYPGDHWEINCNQKEMKNVDEIFQTITK